MYMVERSDKSHSIYPRAVSMTVFALHPEAITQGWLLYRTQLLTGRLWYAPYLAIKKSRWQVLLAWFLWKIIQPKITINVYNVDNQYNKINVHDIIPERLAIEALYHYTSNVNHVILHKLNFLLKLITQMACLVVLTVSSLKTKIIGWMNMCLIECVVSFNSDTTAWLLFDKSLIKPGARRPVAGLHLVS